MSALPKIYCWCNQGAGTDFQTWVAMCEDGEVITSHICSHESWARTDLHDRKTALYETKFGGVGDGRYYALVWEVAPADVYARNQALAAEYHRTADSGGGQDSSPVGVSQQNETT